MDKIEDPADRIELVRGLNNSFGLELAEQVTSDGLEALLAEKLDALILSDFNALVGILYRIDVDESRLKKMLKANAGSDAGRIMARMIIERQWQKI